MEGVVPGHETIRDMTAGQHIDYDALALEALRGVVKACLAQVARTGLLGDHHFYIAFNTRAAGVVMSKRLREKYPVEMTIVLQHRFKDLAVVDDRFEVELTFDGIPERLVIPFKAVKVFYDPSVPYGLQFEDIEPSATPDAARRATRRAMGFARGAETEGNPASPDMVGGGDASDQGGRRRPRGRPRPERGQDIEAAPIEPVRQPGQGKPVAPAAEPGLPAAKPAIVALSKPEGAGEETSPKPDSGAKIFDLSKFRGKK
jgi:hypothetical protein